MDESHLIRILIIALAAYGWTVLWRFGDMFADYRMNFEVSYGWLARLMNCQLCLSFHVSLLLLALDGIIGWVTSFALDYLELAPGNAALRTAVNEAIKTLFIYVPASAGICIALYNRTFERRWE